MIKRLRDAGAIGESYTASSLNCAVLAKTNLTEFANFKGRDLPNGWSAVGGQAKSVYVPGAEPLGSSTGSAMGLSAGFGAVALGTETAGSNISLRYKALMEDMLIARSRPPVELLCTLSDHLPV